MNHQEYINSDILKDYSLGLLSPEENARVEEACRQLPEVKQELMLIQQSLEKYAFGNRAKPNGALKNSIWNTLQNPMPEADLNLNDLPVLDKNSDYKNWLRVVKPLIPEKPKKNIFTKVIRDTGKVKHILVVAHVDYPDETHEAVKESILVLEGECLCRVGDKEYKLTAGDYIDIPMHLQHDVKILTPRVIAVVQHIAA